MDENSIETGKYLVQLLSSVLKKVQPKEKPSNIAFEGLYKMAKFHRVECMAFYAIEKMHSKPDADLFHEWNMCRERHISKSYIQLMERDRILNHLTQAKIAVLPLKGCLLKEMYPQADFRQMADLDILIDASKAKESKNILESLGYHVISYDIGNHDVYEKKPYSEVELHRSMIGKSFENHAYYHDVWSKAVQAEANPFCFHFSWDDYYIFLLIHFAKHYYEGGSGIRSIMDIYVFLEQYGEKLNQAYLRKELEQIELYEFKKQAEMLAEAWFKQKKMSDKTKEMEQSVISSGAYGTRKKSVSNRLRKIQKKTESQCMVKWIYFFSRMFPDYEWMCNSYYILKKIPVLLPFCWVHRLISAIVKKRNRVEEEFKAMKQDDER